MPKISGISNSLGYTSHSQHVEQHQHDANCNRGVGNIESPEMNASPVHVDEVDHVACRRAIDQIADRAAKNQRQTDNAPRAARAAVSSAYVATAASATMATDTITSGFVDELDVVQHAKCRARVADVSEVEEARNHRHAFMQRQVAP